MILTKISTKDSTVDAKKLAKNWSIGLKAAARTIDATTQMAVRDFSDVSGKRRLKPHHTMMDWKRIQGTVYTDTLCGPCKSLSGKTHSQVHATDYQYVQTYSMEREKKGWYTHSRKKLKRGLLYHGKMNRID